MAGVTKDCERCGETFAAKRADARFCSSGCRQAAHRERTDPVASPGRLSPAAVHRRRVETKVRTFGSIMQRYGAHDLEVTLDSADVPTVLDAPGVPLDEWDRELTGTIQLLSRLRRAIRDKRDGNE